MTANPAVVTAVRDGYITKDSIMQLLGMSGRSGHNQAGQLWRFFTVTARKAGLKYIVDCQVCGPTENTWPCKDLMVKHHIIIAVHGGSIIRGHSRFKQSHFTGIGPRLRALMQELVDNLK